MTIITLPSSLPGALDLASANRSLRAGTASLDWRAVRAAEPDALAALLAGLTLAGHADVLGLDTVPDALAPRIGALCGGLLPGDGSAPGQPSAQDPYAPDGASAVGTAGDSATPAVPGMQVQGRLGFDPLPPTLFDPPLPAPDTLPVQSQGSQVEYQRPQPLVHAHQPAPSAAALGTMGVPGDETGAGGPLLAPPSPAAIREELERAVLLDLLGPAGGPDEEVAESVRDRYLVGLLAPKNSTAPESDDDDVAVGGASADEDGADEQDTPIAQSLFPSSFGLTCAVALATPALRARCRWGRYERVASERLTTDKGAPKQVWKRIPVEAELTIPLTPAARFTQEVVPEGRGVEVQAVVRKLGDLWIVSAFLVNAQSEPPKLKDRAWLFQAELILEALDGSPVFCCRPHVSHSGEAERVEEDTLAMLYRRQCEFAAGHGVSVAVTPAPDRADRALQVATCVAPSYEVPQTAAPTAKENPDLGGLLLDMQALAERPLGEIVAGLRVLTSAYERWIEARRADVADPESGLVGYGDLPEAVVGRCVAALGRIRAGIDLLSRDETAMHAFRFMNRAMWRQRIRTIYAETVRREGKADLAAIDVPPNRSWRPFQISFILLNLPALTDLAHPERGPEVDAGADLLWFPTGGGKTEAYLGLTAYTLGIRRLQGTVAGHDGEHGVAVLMRYTLRLLTLQQFQRAAALICACESIRREALARGDRRWGEAPFRIGLWVGKKTTPNTTEESAEAVKKDHGNGFKGSSVGGSGSPAQLTNCPWCGSPIDPGKDIQVEPFKGGRGRTLIYCGHPTGDCDFSRRRAPGEGLPVLVVDEEIYRLLPSLLIATVDKFAQMPWRGATQMLFGRVTGYCPRHGFRSPDLEDADMHPRQGALEAVRSTPCGPLRPPDLIIQDELRLISGPLGALVGLYETAVDQLASWEVDGRVVRPKVIASTATIRRAGEQIHALFLRRVEVFPPQGLDAADNFFSLQVRPDAEHPGRRYLGICAPGRRLKAALIRVYVAYLAASQQLYGKYGRAVDPWMTLVGYFNSMRELGGMRRLVDDDVRSRLQHTEQHGLARRGTPRVEELTSRKSATDIPRLLDRLEAVFDPAEEPARGRKGGQAARAAGQQPLDVLLATNMVSVGVDVKRLGLMVVANQPKSTAEYIQATSRVGRASPGLVCTVYNWSRPRDLSHYEHFAHYHATFYQQVEALSVTPFAPRALDRGLASILVALVRLLEPDLAANSGAAKLLYEHPLVEAVCRAITARATGVEGPEIRARVLQDLRTLVDTWIAQARDTTGGQTLGYRSKKDGLTRGLLSAPELGEWPPFTCLMSLREVEPEVGLVLDDRNLDEDRIWEAAQGAAVVSEEVGV